MIARRRLAPAALTFVALLTQGLAGSARGEAEIGWRGSITSDLRLFTDSDLSFERSETTANARLTARLSNHVAAVGDVSLIWTEVSESREFAGLVDRELLDPFRWESDALFVDLIDVGVEGLDLRLGRQQLIWGSADRFHPVSNLNPLDVEDPIVFGKVIANEMITLSFRPEWSAGGDDDEGIEPWFDEFLLQLVFVPFFKPAQLPESAGLAFTERVVFQQRANTELTDRLVAQQEVLRLQNGWEFVLVPEVRLPDRTLANSMFGARLGGRLLGMDLGVTFFDGFDDLPRVTKVMADATAVPRIDVDLVLAYPRVQVYGFDMATSLDFLDGVGLWTEIGVTRHQDLYRIVATGPEIGVNAIEVEHEAGAFVKAVVGVDYTPAPWLYLNVQYLHGFVDEIGAAALDDYIVAGGDLKMDHDRVLLRFFNIFSISDGSYVLYPQLVFRPWDGGELTLGGFIYSSSFGGFDETKKFESRAAGRSSVFIQAKASL